MLAKSKLNSIQSLISQALNDMDISHKECIIILNEKNKNERMKYNLRSENEHNKQKIVKLSSIKSKNKRHQKNFFVFFIYIKMLEITRKNYYKCDLQTIIFPNDSQCFWINLKDFEVETKSNWWNIFNKYGNSSTLKYKKELTPNIQFQPYRIFTRNDLFERIIKSCKATNVEFLMIKEKLGLCLYEIICDEQEYILPEMQDDIKELK